mgnify:FL=1
MAILCVITVYVYLPVFYNLELISTYEYLERRFDNKARQFASFLYALGVFLYLPIVVYIPALAFSAGKFSNLVIAKVLFRFSSYWSQCTFDHSSRLQCVYILHHNRRFKSGSMDRHFTIYCDSRSHRNCVHVGS